MRQSFNEGIRITQLRGSDAFLVSRIQPAIADIVHDGSGEDEAVLQHDTQLAAEGVQGHLADIVFLAVLAAQENPSAVQIIEPAEQVDDCALSCTGGTHQGDAFPGVNMEVHMLQEM